MFLVVDIHNARPYTAQKHCIVIVIQYYNDFCNKWTEYVGGEIRSLWKYFHTDIPANQLCMWSSELVGRNERLARVGFVFQAHYCDRERKKYRCLMPATMVVFWIIWDEPFLIAEFLHFLKFSLMQSSSKH